MQHTRTMNALQSRNTIAIPSDRPLRVGLLLIPGFALLPYSATIEPMRAANRLSGNDLFCWKHVSPDGSPVSASNGVTILPDYRVGETTLLDLVFVCAGSDVETYRDTAPLAWLRSLVRHGTAVGGISGGTYLLACAGVLEGYRCTMHWDHVPGFLEQFANLEMTGRLYEIDRNRLSCSGGIAALDMMHELIEAWHGPELAAAVSEWFLHNQIRDGSDPQRMDLQHRLGINHPKLLRVVEQMERHIEKPLSRAAIADLAGLSIRQVERLFRNHLGNTIARYYRGLRLSRARKLLQQTALPIVEVAIATGFESPDHFGRAFRHHFGHRPRTERRPVAR